MVSEDTCPIPVSWYTSGDRKTGSTATIISFFKAPSTAVYFLNSPLFCQNLSVPSTCSWAFPMFGGKFSGLCGGTNAKPVCAMYSLLVIVRARCMCRPPLRFDATDASFPLINWYKLISPYLVGSPPIFVRIGVGNSARTPSTQLVAAAMMHCTPVGIDGGFVPLENSSNLLKSWM